jgi:glutaminyl-peptide cyclotransferase
MLAPLVALSLALSFSACKSDTHPENEAAQPAPKAKAWQPTAADFTLPANAPAAPRVDGKRAMQYTKEIVGFGSRPIGSAAHQKVEEYIQSKLKGDTVEVDSFTAQTAAGQYPMRNIIAKYPGKKDGIIVLASHYDTNLPLPKNFVGANDGASTSGLLLELANQLRGKERDGYSVWLVWTDGEEATVKWSDSDSLYGSKHLAQKWAADGTAKKVKAFILLDMIGDADLDIDRDSNSTPWLLDLIEKAATTLGYQSHFFQRENTVNDDHLPFAKLGIPVADIIDINYGYNNVFHHTPDDTLDKLSPQSLKIVGDTVLETIRLMDAH